MGNIRGVMSCMITGAVVALLFSPMSWAEEKNEDSSRWKHQLSVEERFRYEYKHDFDLSENSKDNGSVMYQRIKIGFKESFVDESANEKFEFFIEGLDAAVGGYQIKPVAAQKDTFDLHQAYVKLSDIMDSDFSLTLGRKELKYGKGRLIGNPAWGNRVPHFDAGILRYVNGGFSGDLLFAQNVKYNDHNFNRSLNEESIGGVYFGYQKDKTSPTIEWYFLAQAITNTPITTKRYTVGSRVEGKVWDGIGWEVELPYQFGETNGIDISAYALSASLWKQFEETLWKPKAFLEYNQASGDKDPNDNVSHTFNPLYQATHDGYGLIDFFRWQNMREVALSVAVSPTKKFKLTPQINFLWLDSKFDSWVNSSGSTVRSQTSGDRDYYVGTEASLRANYEVNKNLKFESGYVHFFSGGYVKDSGADDDADWLYTQAVFKY